MASYFILMCGATGQILYNENELNWKETYSLYKKRRDKMLLEYLKMRKQKLEEMNEIVKHTEQK